MLILAIILSALMLLVFYYDATRYIIPNWLVGLVILLYPPVYFLAEAAPDWQMALATFAGLFTVGFILFSTNIMGGGDVKLLAACGLWTGIKALPAFLIYTSLLGGALGILLIAGRPLMAFGWLKLFPARPLPRIFEKSAPIPYGLAIAGAMLILIWIQKLPTLVLSL